MPTVAMLDREIYSEAQAARLLNVHARTLHYWLEGGVYRHKTYAPVLREAPRGTKMLTWGEFVEAGYLRQYRRVNAIPMPALRQFIELLRDSFEVPYPLAHVRPYMGAGRRMVLDAQQAAELPPEFWMLAPATAQQALPLPATEAFLQKVQFADDELGAAVRLYPLGKKKPVVFDPDYSFGEPTVEGIRTEVIAELFEAGESFGEIAEVYSLPLPAVKAAVAYELAAA